MLPSPIRLVCGHSTVLYIGMNKTFKICLISQESSIALMWKSSKQLFPLYFCDDLRPMNIWLLAPTNWRMKEMFCLIVVQRVLFILYIDSQNSFHIILSITTLLPSIHIVCELYAKQTWRPASKSDNSVSLSWHLNFALLWQADIVNSMKLEPMLKGCQSYHLIFRSYFLEHCYLDVISCCSVPSEHQISQLLFILCSPVLLVSRCCF